MVSLKLLSVSALVAIFARLLTSQSLHEERIRANPLPARWLSVEDSEQGVTWHKGIRFAE
jgi:hypothetical protein